MDPTSRKKKPKSPQEGTLNIKNSVTCMNVPESLFDVSAAKKHFSKFGRVHRIRLFPKRDMCMIEYDQQASVEKALLNAGAFDGFMFDVTRTKPRIRKHSKKEDDPDWVPDPDVEKELSAMSGSPSYRIPRQKPMELEVPAKSLVRTAKQIPVRKKAIVKEPTSAPVAAAAGAATGAAGAGAEAGAAPTSLSTAEAAAELVQLRARRSLSADDQWRALDARDRILRAWGGAGARVRVGGATVGRCRDMCPEKERLQRMAEHQVMSLETDPTGRAAPALAVKQYSRSSADQEMPMCYELRPPATLARTCAYLLHEVADTTRQVSLADWFHFMWDRFRGIRKDITQQALCCAESIRLVEACARFHAHCAARLADLEYTQFDQKLNTENLSKCLQTLKHMYADVPAALRPREAEFRGYVALLNLGDANFWWEIKQLPLDVQKSEPITFAMKIYNALDNNNYVRFFRLIRERATYLQACVLLRYCNDVRARALARMLKAFAPRGGSRYPAYEIVNTLAFESPDAMKSFISHYGLRCAKVDDGELTVILDRHQFIEDSDPYPVSREIKLIESKRQCSVGEVIAGGPLPEKTYENHTLHCSFNNDGSLTESSLLAEDLGYNTFNDTNKDVNSLKAEVLKLSSNYKSRSSDKSSDFKENVFSQPVSFSPKSTFKTAINNQNGPLNSNQFHFKPAIQVAPTDVIKDSPEKVFGVDMKNNFSFSTPQPIIKYKETTSSFKTDQEKPASTNIFAKLSEETKYESKSSQNLFKVTSSGDTNIFKKPDDKIPMPAQATNKVENKLFADSNVGSGLFSNPRSNVFGSKNELGSGSSLFAKPVNEKEGNVGNIFAAPPVNKHNLFATTSSENIQDSKNIFKNPLIETNLFAKVSDDKVGDTGSIFSKPASTEAKPVQQSDPKSLFGGFKSSGSNLFSEATGKSESLFSKGSELGNTVLSPGSLFKSVIKTTNGPNTETYSIFASKNKPSEESVAANIFNSVNDQKQDVYDFKEDEEKKIIAEEEKRKEEEQKLERQRLEAIQKEQERQQAIKREQDRIQQEEAKRKQEELRQAEEERRKREEQKKQEELKKKLDEEKIIEALKKAEEDKLFKAKVDKESSELVDELLNNLNDEIVRQSIDEEIEIHNKLMIYAQELGKDIISELCEEICENELKAERYLTRKLISKWISIWKTQLIRNTKRRKLLENTPVWISDKSPVEKALSLRRMVETHTLRNMNAVNKGYRFSGLPNCNPITQPYNIMEIIRSPLLKRMKQISYPYDKCFFWKVTLVSPGPMMWMNRKVEVESWLLEVFNSGRKHDVSETLIHVSKESWNNLMDFATSVSLTNMETSSQWSEALEGSNAIIFYITELDKPIAEIMNQILQQKFEYQVIPVVAIVSKEFPLLSSLEEHLAMLLENRSISGYKIVEIDPQNVYESMNLSTKSALKWLARKFPPVPGLEIDYLKSICERYLGNEIWQRLKFEKSDKFKDILKSVSDLVVIYNTAVDKLSEILGNEDLFNYPTFPLEFRKYLSDACPYPKPSEYITSNVRTSENVSAIKSILSQLKLPRPSRAGFVSAGAAAVSPAAVQDGIRAYCRQLGWGTDPEELVCKVVAVLPDQFTNFDLSCEDFSKYFENYDMLDILNIIVYEKIKRLNNFDNRFAIYKKSQLDEYCKCMWWYELDVVVRAKQTYPDCEDVVDYYIEAKRRKIAEDSLEYLALEDKDQSMVDESIVTTDKQISKYNNCTATIHELETQLETERLKSLELENLLKTALGEV